jgi:hypothetical protein
MCRCGEKGSVESQRERERARARARERERESARTRRRRRSAAFSQQEALCGRVLIWLLPGCYRSPPASLSSSSLGYSCYSCLGRPTLAAAGFRDQTSQGDLQTSQGDHSKDSRQSPVSSQAKFCLFSETPYFRVLRAAPPARTTLASGQRNFPNRRSGADWDQPMITAAESQKAPWGLLDRTQFAARPGPLPA